MSGLHEWMNVYRSSLYACPKGSAYSSECGAILLGTLNRHMMAKGLSSPQPEVPFDGLSFKDIHDKIRSLESPTWYDSFVRHKGHYSTTAHPCGFPYSVYSMADSVAANTKGLWINSFSRTNKK